MVFCFLLFFFFFGSGLGQTQNSDLCHITQTFFIIHLQSLLIREILLNLVKASLGAVIVKQPRGPSRVKDSMHFVLGELSYIQKYMEITLYNYFSLSHSEVKDTKTFLRSIFMLLCDVERKNNKLRKKIDFF